MSRTDKDTPYWVTGDWRPWHSHGCRAGRERCTLGRLSRQHPSWKLYGDRCHWYPYGPFRQAAPPRWYINVRWTAPDRQAVRRAVQVARAEHRAGHEPDAEPPTGQHRNGAKWMWE
jgi:hypothetical protein